MADRVLIIGLEMGDLALIEKWSLEGFLPTFRSLLTEGRWGRLKSTAEALHTSSLPTLFTGSLPGKHGVYYPHQPAPGRQQPEHIGPGQYGVAPFWHLLDRVGKRCIILDAPETFPASAFSGVQIFEWGTWAWYWKRMSTPADLQSELTGKFGPYPLKLEAKRLGLGMPNLSYLHRQLIAGATQKARISKWLMGSRPWDLFLVTFAEPHAAGHYLWPRNAAINGANSASFEAAASKLRDVYIAVDHAIGEIIAACGDDTLAFVISGDGVGPNHCGWHVLPQILIRCGVTATSSTSPGNGHSRKSLVDSFRSAVPPRVRSEIQARLPWQFRHWLGQKLASANVDWSRTKAFALPADLEGCIRINVRGREPHGIVEPGNEYADLCNELTSTLKQLVNPATGRAAVRHVYRIDQLFPGPQCDHLPDLSVIWNDEAEIREVYSEALGLISEAPVDPRTGTHSPLSFMALRGPRSKSGKIEGGHIADLAPTVLAHFGVNPPSEMDGRVLDFVQ